ncbi:beta-ketoacyl synthase N-terminal-like domain-containing protein [Salinispora vitiensis]|uniref:beta-ketoacyl synthase N-terminal-like domain-containing protein n=1 Tax=Salinispora vitiensis TaxID=999544 RepID=UPI000365E5B9|nr:beta-ketoacyl synthase N-terminal-like domain-containing protein [Salinispora vitiensis]
MNPTIATPLLSITGWGVLSSTAVGADDFAGTLGTGAEAVAVPDMFDRRLPDERAHVLVDFHPRDYLGRKGTSFIDRSTALAMVGCDLALSDTDLVVDDENRHRVGVVLGTTAGSIASTSDYSRETLTQDKPYLVNPVLFPNAVMNGAAGQCAIRFKLQGINATVAGGTLAGITALRYAGNALRKGYASALLTGAVEEFSPQTAWGLRALRRPGGHSAPVGEGAVVLVAEDPQTVRATGRQCDADVLAVELGFDPTNTTPTGVAAALARCVDRALRRAGLSRDEVWAVSTGQTGAEPDGGPERLAADMLFDPSVRRLRVADLVGDSQAASAAFQVAEVLAHHRTEPVLHGRVSVITAHTADGAVGAALVRGWHRGGRDHRV